MGHSANRLNPFKKTQSPQAPILSDTVSQTLYRLGRRLFSFLPKPQSFGPQSTQRAQSETIRLRRNNRKSKIANRKSGLLGLRTRRWSGSFHRPDCSISGVGVSTKKSRKNTNKQGNRALGRDDLRYFGQGCIIGRAQPMQRSSPIVPANHPEPSFASKRGRTALPAASRRLSDLALAGVPFPRTVAESSRIAGRERSGLTQNTHLMLVVSTKKAGVKEASR